MLRLTALLIVLVFAFACASPALAGAEAPTEKPDRPVLAKNAPVDVDITSEDESDTASEEELKDGFSETTFFKSTFVLGTSFDPAVTGDIGEDLKTFRLVKRAHFNLLTASVRPSGFIDTDEMDYRLELAVRTGLKSFVGDTRFSHRVLFCAFFGDNCPGFDQTDALAITDHYKNLDPKRRRALVGYFISDEPCDRNYCARPTDAAGNPYPADQIANAEKNWIEHFKVEDPSKLAYVNLYPFIPFLNTTRSAYEAYLDTYLSDPNKERNLDTASFDHYPFNCVAYGSFNEDCTSPTYFYNLDIIRKKAAGRPFWAYPLSVHQGDFRDPDENQLRFMAFSPIAYGAKGLIYFTYARPIDPTYFEALIDDDGTPTPKYYMVQTINHYIEDVVGPVVMRARSLGAFHKSEQPTNESLSADQLITDATSLIRDVSDENILVGVFEEDRFRYGLVVNKSLTLIPDSVVALSGKYSRVAVAPSVVGYRGGRGYQPVTTSYDPLTDTTTFVMPPLAGGEGRLFRVRRR
jgi:hypothetical protein